MIFNDTYPKAYAYVYLRDFDNSERNMFMYLLEEISQKRAFSVDPPSRFDRGVIVTGVGYRLLQVSQKSAFSTRDVPEVKESFAVFI